MPRLSERQQISLLLKNTNPAHIYPPLTHSLALQPTSQSIYQSWSPGRRRLWDRRLLDPAAYLYSYLPPGVPPAAANINPPEHLLFLAALRLVPKSPGNERWARVSLLVPGRTGSECRRYYHRIGRAGFINPEGHVKSKLVSKARIVEGKKPVCSRNAVFLRTHLRKFVPDSLPTLDDSMLREPLPVASPQVQIDLLTYKPAPRPHNPPSHEKPKPHADILSRSNPRPTAEEAPVEPVRKRSKKNSPPGDPPPGKSARGSDVAERKKKLLDIVTRHAGSISAPTPLSGTASLKKPPLPPAHTRQRRPKIRAGGNLFKNPKTRALPRQGKNAALFRPPQPRNSPSKQKIPFKVKAAGGVSQKLVALSSNSSLPFDAHARKKAEEIAGTQQQEGLVTLKLRIRTPAKPYQKASQKSRSTHTRKVRSSVTPVNEKADSKTETLVTEALSKEKRPGVNANCVASHEIVDKDCIRVSKEATVASTNGDVPDAPLVQGKASPEAGVQARSGACIHSPMTRSAELSKKTDEHDRTHTHPILMPSSKRLYGPISAPPVPEDVNPRQQHTASGQGDREEPACHSTTRGFTQVCALAPPNRNDRVGTPGYPQKNDSDRGTDAGTEVLTCLSDSESYPLEPFEEEETISLMDPHEGTDEASVKAPVVPDCVRGDIAMQENRLKPKQENENEAATEVSIASLPTSLVTKISIDFLLCEEKVGKPRDVSMAVVETEKRALSERIGRSCCEDCQVRSQTLGDVRSFELLLSGDYGDLLSWEIPIRAADWTRAWASQHWNACLVAEEINWAYVCFDVVSKRAQQTRELIKTFEGITSAVGERLGHREERRRLLYQFEADNESLLKRKILFIREVRKPQVSAPHDTPTERVSIQYPKFTAEHFISSNMDVQYTDLVKRLCWDWDSRISSFFAILNEVQKRHDMECQAVERICGKWLNRLFSKLNTRPGHDSSLVYHRRRSFPTKPVNS